MQVEWVSRGQMKTEGGGRKTYITYNISCNPLFSSVGYHGAPQPNCQIRSPCRCRCSKGTGPCSAYGRNKVQVWEHGTEEPRRTQSLAWVPSKTELLFIMIHIVFQDTKENLWKVYHFHNNSLVFTDHRGALTGCTEHRGIEECTNRGEWPAKTNPDPGDWPGVTEEPGEKQ